MRLLLLLRVAIRAFLNPLSHYVQFRRARGYSVLELWERKRGQKLVKMRNGSISTQLINEIKFFALPHSAIYLTLLRLGEDDLILILL